jgi:hypothetical protein
MIREFAEVAMGQALQSALVAGATLIYEGLILQQGRRQV